MRAGILATGFQGKMLDIEKLIKRQKSLRTCSKKAIEVECKQLSINAKII